MNDISASSVVCVNGNHVSACELHSITDTQASGRLRRDLFSAQIDKGDQLDFLRFGVGDVAE